MDPADVNLYLVGFMGTGKTTVGRAVAHSAADRLAAAARHRGACRPRVAARRGGFCPRAEMMLVSRVPPTTDPRQNELRRRLEALGFDDVRFASVAAPGGAPLRGWLANGFQADMHWIDRSVDKRLDPQLVLPGARSIVML